MGSAEGVESSVWVGSPERTRSVGSSGSWTLLPSQVLKCDTEMK